MEIDAKSIAVEVVDVRAASGSAKGILIDAWDRQTSDLPPEHPSNTLMYVHEVICAFNNKPFVVIPTGDGANATVQWRNLLFLCARGKADSSRQKEGAQNDKARGAVMEGSCHAYQPRMHSPYIRWKACTPFSCFTLKRPRE